MAAQQRLERAEHAVDVADDPAHVRMIIVHRPEESHGDEHHIIAGRQALASPIKPGTPR